MPSKISVLFIAAILLTSFAITSCGDDEKTCTEAAFSQDLANEASKLTSAASAFGIDPTNTGLCNDYLDALNDYLDEVESYRSCAQELGELTDFNAGIEEARASINGLTCP